MEILASDVFVVVDVQVDFVSASMAIPDAKRIIDPINETAAIFQHVVIATDWHPAGHISFASAHAGARPGDTVQAAYGDQRVGADHCVQGTPGAELDPGLELDKAELILRKGYRVDVDSNGAFWENDTTTPTGLGPYLRSRGIERVFVAGLARYGCVMQTALGAVRDGFTVFMVDDAAEGRPLEPADEAARLATIAAAGVGWVRSTDLVVA